MRMIRAMRERASERAIKARYLQSKIRHRRMHHFCSVGSTLGVKCTWLKYGDSRVENMRSGRVRSNLYSAELACE